MDTRNIVSNDAFIHHCGEDRDGDAMDTRNTVSNDTIIHHLLFSMDMIILLKVVQCQATPKSIPFMVKMCKKLCTLVRELYII